MAFMHRLGKAIKYYIESKTIYNVHSPFLFDWAKSVLEDTRHFYAYSEIEQVRAHLYHNHNEIEVEDLGAGSQTLKGSNRKISDIARTSLSSPSFLQTISRMVTYSKASTILELGTSLGLSSQYMGAAAPSGIIHTLEGSDQIQKIAQQMRLKRLSNIKDYLGNFDEILPGILESLQQIDFAFIDGNHTEEATLRYYHMIKPYCQESSVLVFDDIYWSAGMTSAWEEIKQDPDATLTIDLYDMGIVMFRPQNKQEQVLIRRKFKPWASGLFG